MSGEARDASGPPVIVERHDRVAIIRLNRSAERNPLSVVALEAIDTAFSILISDAEITSIIFTGVADAFASGADIRELSSLTPECAKEFSLRGQRLFQRIADTQQLTVAAVDGYCMGGGLDLALACHLRLASPRAVFAHPGARLGIITGWGGTQRLPQLISAALAAEMFLAGRRLSGVEAFELGLVNYLSERPLERAHEIAIRAAG